MSMVRIYLVGQPDNNSARGAVSGVFLVDLPLNQIWDPVPTWLFTTVGVPPHFTFTSTDADSPFCLKTPPLPVHCMGSSPTSPTESLTSLYIYLSTRKALRPSSVLILPIQIPYQSSLLCKSTLLHQLLLQLLPQAPILFHKNFTSTPPPKPPRQHPE